MPTTYPAEFKVQTIRRCEKGESIKVLSQQPHISQSTLYQWSKKCCSIQMPNRTHTPTEFDANGPATEKVGALYGDNPSIRLSLQCTITEKACHPGRPI